MLSKKIINEINGQINEELSAWYTYLAMAAHAENLNFPGFALFLRHQAEEEHGHAMKLYTFLIEWGADVELMTIKKPTGSYTTMLDVFQKALKSEQHVNDRVNALYEQTFKEKAFAAHLQFQWFVTEQIEEVKNSQWIVEQLKMAKNDAAAMLLLDREVANMAASDDGA
ncbi:MAG: ferritin [Verrucomicrobia bacterium]|nr:ferritin [Verrucomicrobiota bacterium]MDA1086894.1 ferritin [Verrucomicrobiota bacterium]